MLHTVFFILASAVIPCLADDIGLPPLGSAREIVDYEDSGAGERRPFAFTGIVTAVVLDNTNRPRLYVLDSTGCVQLLGDPSVSFHVGDYLLFRGETCTEFHEPWAAARHVDRLGSRPLPPPIRCLLRDLNAQDHNLRTVIVEGDVIDSFPDEIDSRFHILLLKDKEVILPVSLCSVKKSDADALVNAHVRISGIYNRYVSGARAYQGPYVGVDTFSDIVILTPPPADPFAAPPLETLRYVSPAEIACRGKRSVTGEVLAIWQNRNMLLRTADDFIVSVSLSGGQDLPCNGQSVTVAGYPETDLFTLWLTRAIWRPAPPLAQTADSDPEEVKLKDFFVDKNGQNCIDTRFMNKLVRTTAFVKSLPAESDADQRITLSDGTFTLHVSLGTDLKNARTVKVDCKVRVTGYCLIETSRWQPQNVFPRPTGITVITRTPEDVEILANPPWWTIRRLMILVGVLVALIIGISTWNRILNQLVERRSRQLLREQTARADASLKVDERTRLAVELHDSLSQTLTGVSFQLDAAQEARRHDPTLIGECLDAAQRTLASCREELKNCLWDLRHNALEEPDLNKAIQTTLNPHVLGVEIAVDCSIPRNRLSDSTFHNILAIIRELTVNAVRHGNARHISIRGQIAARTITFCVADDGCGFDPDSRPGMDDGHFGLLGVGERLDKLGGWMDISSVIGKGTTVSIVIEGRHEEDSHIDR